MGWRGGFQEKAALAVIVSLRCSAGRHYNIHHENDPIASMFASSSPPGGNFQLERRGRICERPLPQSVCGEQPFPTEGEGKNQDRLPAVVSWRPGHRSGLFSS